MAYPLKLVIPTGHDLSELEAHVQKFNREVWEVLGRCKVTILFYEALQRDFADVIQIMGERDPATANFLEYINTWKESVKDFARLLPYLSNGAAYIVGYRPVEGAPLQLGIALASQIDKMEKILGKSTGEEIVEGSLLSGQLGQFPFITKVVMKFRKVIVTVAKVAVAAFVSYVGLDAALRAFDIRNEQLKVDLQRKILQFLETFSKSDPKKAEEAKEILRRIEEIAKKTSTKSWIEKITGINFGEGTKAFMFSAGLGIGLLLLLYFARRR